MGFAALWGMGAGAQKPLVETEKAGTAEVFTRERANGDASLLLSLAMNAGKIDEVRVSMPSDDKVTAGSLPAGWAHEQKGKQLRAFGPPVDAADLRFDLKPGSQQKLAGRQVRLEGSSAGRRGLEAVNQVALLDKVQSTPNLEGILTLAPQATPGEPLLAGVSGNYRRGTWTFRTGSGATVPLLSLRDLQQIPGDTSGTLAELRSLTARQDVIQLLQRPDPLPYITIHPGDDTLTGVRFVDRWGEVLVDAPVSLAPVPAAACPLQLTGGSEFAFAGQAACVSGCFPDLTAPYGLTLDGRELSAWAVSPTSAMLGIPADTPAGSHAIEVPGSGSRITVGVLQVEGSIDSDKLLRGESTTMRLRVVGTDKPLPLVVLNRTPGIITIEGGVHQVLTSAGGADNAVARSVRGIRRGNFEITYSLSAAGCGLPPSSAGR